MLFGRSIGKMDKDTTIEFITIFQRIFNVIDKMSVEGLEEEVFETSCKYGLTIYDASYVTVAAMKNGCILVTDDGKLTGKASGVLKVKSKRRIHSTIGSLLHAKFIIGVVVFRRGMR